MLKLKDVTKVFEGNLLALDRISLRMERGEFCLLIGPNKAGKTTLLKLIALEERPTGGEITFDGFNSKTIKKKEIPLLRRKMGRIFPDFRLINDWDVFDNVALSLRILGAKENKIKNKVHQVLEMVGLSGKDRFSPGDLSSGEKQRVAIARAIAGNPVLLLADEPTLNLDEENRNEILDLVKKINLLGTAVLLASHDFHLCEDNLTKIIRIEKGSLV